ncbi:adenosine deaminase [Pusillimonas sp.]|uniref:adenosine deaminase n=1 Tax=Pusillimonas sp. TaxID=3040095 RepID=UPI0037C76416
MSTNSNNSALRDFIVGLPKTELHLHIEGTLEPEMIFLLAQRNGVKLAYESEQALRDAYAFTDLQSFLDLYYAGAGVLITEHDFHDMTLAYLRRIHADGVRHVEIMFDPQTHTVRGVAMETIFKGLASAMRQARSQWGISGYLILSFLRHLSEEDAFTTLEQALPLREQYADIWTAIGLDSAERGNPPEKFERVYAKCRELGFRLVAHAGEEGPPAYVRDALDLLHVERIDHGVRSEEDPGLMQRLLDLQMPLTVCPLSNLKLCVFDAMEQHNLARLLRRGLRVTVNSDDPAYFGGYLADNYMAVAQALDLSRDDLAVLARNSILACFLPEQEKNFLLDELDNYLARA